MGERRGTRRQKIFLRGLVYFDERRGAMSCLVRDLSDAGARIIFSENVTLPGILNLHIAQRDLTLRARVQWRHGQEIGLAFEAASAAAASPRDSVLQRIQQKWNPVLRPDTRQNKQLEQDDDAKISHRALATRLEQLETEIAALKRTIKKLKRENKDGGAVEAA
jgi:PilZ domain